ncbi:hypothetical protein EVAR_88984_1 [Eumeta japonica]|uniref:Uncharacterized protein n=1 Tax=Eumeta variegata TaxID=151549 RepID=A0A4C1VQI7_EUMVA|nr:hypothetical protein EVAR_88984_1 [Eumeta japonica]
MTAIDDTVERPAPATRLDHVAADKSESSKLSVGSRGRIYTPFQFRASLEPTERDSTKAIRARPVRELKALPLAH